MTQMLCYRTVLLADWNMFWDSSNVSEEYTTSVIGFINKCIDDVVPTVTVPTYPNQKPWITGNIRTKLPLSRSGTRIRELIRNPAMPSDKLSNRQSSNTGIRSNRITMAPRSLVVAGLANYYRPQRESQPRATQ
jgi:hypothetical protein